MDAITALHTRNSVSQLSEPGPSQEQLEIILKAGYRACDRKRLRPWKFLMIEGEGRNQLGEICLNDLLRENPDLDEEARQKELAKPLRAPNIIVVVARIRPDIKVPNVEQLLSAGGAAQMMMVAAHAQGIGAIWRTGAAAYSKSVHEDLGLSPEDGDQIVGFLYLGTTVSSKQLDDFNLDNIVSRWPG